MANRFMTNLSESDHGPAPANSASAAERVRVKDAFFAAIDEAEGYKATQLAEAAGVTDATLSFMRHQGRDVRTSTFQRLLDAMPADVYLRFYQHLGLDLEQNALAQSDTAVSAARTISALLPLCDDESLVSLMREIGALAKQRHEAGSTVLSVLTLLMELMQYCDLEDIPELIDKVGKHTSTAIGRASEKTPVDMD